MSAATSAQFREALVAGDLTLALGALISAAGTAHAAEVHTMALYDSVTAGDSALGLELTRHLLVWEEAEFDADADFVGECLVEDGSSDKACLLLVQDGRFALDSGPVDHFSEVNCDISKNALVCAAFAGHAQTLEFLLDTAGFPVGAHVSVAAICRAVGNDDEDTFRTLLASDRIDPAEDGCYCLAHCALVEDEKYFELLLEDPRMDFHVAYATLRAIGADGDPLIGDEPHSVDEALEWMREHEWMSASGDERALGPENEGSPRSRPENEGSPRSKPSFQTPAAHGHAV